MQFKFRNYVVVVVVFYGIPLMEMAKKLIGGGGYINGSRAKTTHWIGLINIANESLFIGLPHFDIFLPDFFCGWCDNAR